jgi:hypothetical protein
LETELREMMLSSPPEVHPLLNAIDKWMFVGGSVAECLIALDLLASSVVASKPAIEGHLKTGQRAAART